MSDTETKPNRKRYAHPGGHHWMEVRLTYARRYGRLVATANAVKEGLTMDDGTRTELYPLYAGTWAQLPDPLDKQYVRHPIQKTINKLAAAYFETPECLALVEKAKEIAARQGYWP